MPQARTGAPGMPTPSCAEAGTQTEAAMREGAAHGSAEACAATASAAEARAGMPGVDGAGHAYAGTQAEAATPGSFALKGPREKTEHGSEARVLMPGQLRSHGALVGQARARSLVEACIPYDRNRERDRYALVNGTISLADAALVRVKQSWADVKLCARRQNALGQPRAAHAWRHFW